MVKNGEVEWSCGVATIKRFEAGQEIAGRQGHALRYNSYMTNHVRTGVCRDDVSFCRRGLRTMSRGQCGAGDRELCRGSRSGRAGIWPRGSGRWGTGQPPYDPADLLKLYLYGYLNRVRSSRRLEQDAAAQSGADLALRGLRPRDRTIAGFRKVNAAALKAANRNFVAGHPPKCAFAGLRLTHAA